jgi:hypothetical protein
MSPIEFSGSDVLINGVPAKDLVSGLKAAGLSDQSVTDLLAQAISRGAALAGTGAEATQLFQFQTEISETADECAATFSRAFVHPDFFDGLTVVQAGTTPEELGFNFRFHAIEADLDAVSSDLHKLSNCLAELRREVFGMARELEVKITQIDALLDAKGKEKEKDTKEIKEKDKEKDHKEGKDKEKEGKEGKDKEKDHKEGKDKDKEKEGRDKLQPVEKALPNESLHGPQIVAGPEGADVEAEAPEGPGGAPVFIRPDERPAVGERALRAAGDG